MSETITYYHRGHIEVPAPRNGKPGYRWAEGYSANSETGGEMQPWMTRRECQREAKEQGKRAVFKQ